MFRKHTLSASAGVATLLAAGPVFAQAAPTLIVSFSGVANDVPLDPWSSMAAALFIVLIAATIFRRRMAGRVQRPGLWMAAAVAVAGATAGSIAFNAIPDAHAQLVQTLPLSTSPASIVVGGSNATVIAQNATGVPIRLISVVLANPAPAQTIQTPPTTCVAGLTLASGQTCVISVASASS